MMTKPMPHQAATAIALRMIVESPYDEPTAPKPLRRADTGSSRMRGDKSDSHHRFTKALHWGMIPLILVALVAVLARDWVEDSALRKELLVIHQTLGMAALAVLLLRYGWRFLARANALHREMPIALRLGATIGHSAIYLVFFALCILGWLVSDAFNRHPRLLGYDWLPFLIRPDRALGDRLQEWHVDIAWIVGFLIASHVAAALWHHFVRRDRVLLSMLPAPPEFRPAWVMSFTLAALSLSLIGFVGVLA